MKRQVLYFALSLSFMHVHAQELFTCHNPNYEYLERAIGDWEVQTKDRTSPGVYESNSGVASITPSIEGCGISISYLGEYRSKKYARDVTIVGVDSTNLQMVAMDSEHGSFSILNGSIANDTLQLFWYRNAEVKRLQSKYLMTFRGANEFEFSSYLSTDYGETWALTHERVYKKP